MSIQDMFRNDLDNIFLNKEEFGIEIEYTPEGETKAKKINAFFPDEQDSQFYTGTDIHDFDVFEMIINGVCDEKGHINVKETGRGGPGDTLTIPGKDDTYWVKKILDGADRVTKAHRLVIANTPGALLDE